MELEEFKRLIIPLSGKLLRFAQKFLHDRDLAEDIVQDVFVRLWKKRGVLEKLDNAEAYAMRVTRNLCIDRSKAKRGGLYRDADIYANLRDESPRVDEQMEKAESALIVKHIINSLPEQQRMVIYLRDVEHYDYEEISDVMNMKSGAVRANLSRARKKVRDEILKIQKIEETCVTSVRQQDNMDS
jgi:RNA polymerase sigma-70 factor (ECF subfamily)